MSSDGFAARAQSATDRQEKATAAEAGGKAGGDVDAGGNKAAEVVAGKDGESVPK